MAGGNLVHDAPVPFLVRLRRLVPYIGRCNLWPDPGAVSDETDNRAAPPVQGRLGGRVSLRDSVLRGSVFDCRKNQCGITDVIIRIYEG